MINLINLLKNPFVYVIIVGQLNAGMAELADAQDLGSCGKPCRFETCYLHLI